MCREGLPFPILIWFRLTFLFTHQIPGNWIRLLFQPFSRARTLSVSVFLWMNVMKTLNIIWKFRLDFPQIKQNICTIYSLISSLLCFAAFIPNINSHFYTIYPQQDLSPCLFNSWISRRHFRVQKIHPLEQRNGCEQLHTDRDGDGGIMFGNTQIKWNVSNNETNNNTIRRMIFKNYSLSIGSISLDS